MSAPRWCAGALAALGAFAAVALVGPLPGAGFALLGAAMCAVCAAAIGRYDGWTAGLWVTAAALMAFPALRDAGWVWFPCASGGLLLASLAAAGGASGRQVVAGLLAVVGRLPLGLVFALAPAARAAEETQPARVWPAVRGAVLAAVLLAVFVPLFASADAAFAEMLDRAIPSEVEVDHPVGRLLALAGVLAAGGSLLLAAVRGPARAARPPRMRLTGLEWVLPLGALVAVFAAFVGVQLTTLFGGHDYVLRTTGLTYAEYAREGFGQLIAAALLTLGVIAAARRWAGGRPRLLRGLLAALCVLCLVVLASALERLGLYEEAFGFTKLRFAAHAHILWLGAVLLLVLAAVAAGSAPWLPRAVVGVSAAGALAFALSNPDGRIAAHNVERFERSGKLDLAYLTTLSADAAPALAGLPPGRAACATLGARGGEDSWAGWNAGRARARDVLAGLPAPADACPEPGWD